MPPHVLPNENHVKSENHRATQRDRVSSIQAAESFGRNHQEVKTSQRGKCSKPDPCVDTPAAKRREKNGHQHHARSGDECSFRCGGKFQSSRLKRIPAKHKETYLHSRPSRMPSS